MANLNTEYIARLARIWSENVNRETAIWLEGTEAERASPDWEARRFIRETLVRNFNNGELAKVWDRTIKRSREG